MNKSFKNYISPIDGSELALSEGGLVDKSGNLFPIINEIPRFVELENYSSSFGFQWNEFVQTQVDYHNDSFISRDRFYRSTRWTDDSLNGAMVLEIGSGSGRFSQILLEAGADLYSLDYSNAVEANAKNNRNYENLTLCQASVYAIPFRKESFDKVCCLGVIQHTPDVELSFATMIQYLKPGGEIVVDVYADTLKTKFYTKYWFRPITKRMNKKRLLSLIRWYVPKWITISTLLLKVPIIGKFLAQIIPICNYSEQFPTLTKEELKEWAILDTFDMLSPEFDQPQKRSTLKSWIKNYDLDLLYLGRGDNGYVLIARKKVCAE
jgi:SAM-dependent methyltransferase